MDLVKLPVVKCMLLLAVGAMGCILMGQYRLKRFPHLSFAPPKCWCGTAFMWMLKHNPPLSHLIWVIFLAGSVWPTSSWARFVASQHLDWHKGFGGRVPGLGASCAMRHLMSMNLDVSFLHELLAIPSPGGRLFYLVGGCNWFTVAWMSMETMTQ